MTTDWQQRLKRLGVVKGARNLITPPLAPPAYSPPPPASIFELYPHGRLEHTPHSACFVVDAVYPLHHQHGTAQLQELLQFHPAVTLPFIADPRFQELTFRDFLFIDTETTGLSGAGTLAFMVGVGYFEQSAFVVRQYFLRDQADEPAMLHLLGELLHEKKGVISFNGRTFDLPLLDNRYLMNRLNLPFGDVRDLPHLDLLHPARRLWRLRLTSCSLSSLEKNLLAIGRTQEDVPGAVIPSLYLDYLRSGDARPLHRVFYHNHQDMLSMVTLATQFLKLWHRPGSQEHPQDLLSLARWYIQLERLSEAEQLLQTVLQRTLPIDDHLATLQELAQLLKQQERRPEAVPLWEQIALYSTGDVTAHLELAKFYEWHQPDLPQALNWSKQALGLATYYQPYATDLLAELHHRLARLERKTSGTKK